MPLALGRVNRQLAANPPIPDTRPRRTGRLRRMAGPPNLRRAAIPAKPIDPEGAMSRISMELQRLETAIGRLERAVESADQRRDDAWKETGEKMDLTVERVDRAIHRLETVLED